MTSRGLTEQHMREVAGWIARVIQARGEPAVVAEVRARVDELAAAYPIYDWRL